MSLFSMLEASPLALTLVFFVLGLVIGSFLNVVILRLPRMMERDWQRQCRELLELDKDVPEERPLSLARPASTCPHCHHRIRWYENIPLVSYALLRGRCAACGETIAWRYPVVELAAGILAAACAWHFGYGASALFATIFSWALLTLSVIDLDTQYLPDDITLPLLWLGLALNLFGLFTTLESAVLGTIGGYGILWLIFHGFRLLTGKEGMGYGDFKLLALLGAWLGWAALPLIIVLASFVGAIAGVCLILFASHDRQVPIPFGPYLAAAGWIALIWGDSISQAYLNWAM